jgi:hypothetical protein
VARARPKRQAARRQAAAKALAGDLRGILYSFPGGTLLSRSITQPYFGLKICTADVRSQKAVQESADTRVQVRPATTPTHQAQTLGGLSGEACPSAALCSSRKSRWVKGFQVAGLSSTLQD